jgi:hypothetical protein
MFDREFILVILVLGYRMKAEKIQGTDSDQCGSATYQ